MIYQPKPGADYTAPTIAIDNNTLNVVDKFTYLGSTISQKALIYFDISAQICKASGSFGKLTNRLWRERRVQDMIPNTEVLQRCAQNGIEHHIKRAQLRLSGHLVRMADDRIPKTVFYRELDAGHRKCEDIESGTWTCLRQR